MFFFFAACMLAAPSPVPVLPFAAAVSYSLQHHPQLRAAAWAETAAEGQVAQVRAAAWPHLTATAAAVHLSQDKSASIAPNQLTAAVQLAVPLVAMREWGAWTHSKTAARLQILRTQTLRRRVALDVARAYFAVQLAAQLVEVGQNAVDQGTAHFNYTDTRAKGGVGTQLDALRADQDLAQSESIRVMAVSALARAQLALGVAMGADGPIDAESAVDARLWQVPAAPSEEVDGRADVQFALQDYEAARQIEADNWRDYTPTVVLRAEPFWAHPQTVLQPTWGWAAALSLSLPLYDGEVRYGLAHQRHALTQERLQTLKAMRRLARAEVRAAHAVVLQADAAQVAALRASVAARSAVALAGDAYRGGTTDNLAVIDAQRRDRDAHSAAAIADDALLRARLDYLAATGLFPP